MPKLTKDHEEELREVIRLQGSSEKMTAKLLRAVQAETRQEGASATKEIHQQLLEELRRQKKQGIKFGKADILEFLGQDEDELPPEFEELLHDDESPPESEPPGPSISFEPPTGWSSERVSSALHIRKGRKLIGEVRVIDDFSLRKALHSNEIRDRNQSQKPLAVDPGWIKSAVQFGDTHGYKFIYIQAAPNWKRIQYLLEVPGGKVNVVLDACGKAFDEAAFEDKLTTLQISRGA